MPTAIVRRDLSVVVISLLVTGCTAVLWMWATAGTEPGAGQPVGAGADPAGNTLVLRPAAELGAPRWPADEPVVVVRTGTGDAIPGSREQFLLFRWEEEPGADSYQLTVRLGDGSLHPIVSAEPWYQLDVVAFQGQLCLEVAARAKDGRTGPPSEERCHVLAGPLPFAPPPWPAVPVDTAPAGEPWGTVVVSWVDIGFAASHRIHLTLDDRFLEERIVAPGTARAEFDLAGRSGQLCVTTSAFAAEVPESDPSEPACIVLG